jgi:hypothetical protein
MSVEQNIAQQQVRMKAARFVYDLSRDMTLTDIERSGAAAVFREFTQDAQDAVLAGRV